MLTIPEIRRRLNQPVSSNTLPESPYPPDFQISQPIPAAVLIPFIEKEDGWHLLYIRRTANPTDRHSGQVAFPGGSTEISDNTPEDAAKREASEEVGINPSELTLLGRVQDILTITNFRITPVVGILPWPYRLHSKCDEVARIFSIPLNWLANPENRTVKMRGFQIIGQNIPVIYFRKFCGELLWGATARMTVILLESLGLSIAENRYT